MKAVRIHEDGGPEVLRYEDAPDPVPGTGQVLIELRAASLNHLDVWVRKGLPSVPKPRILGADGAGVVVSGDGFAPGDRVVINPGHELGNGKVAVFGEHSDGTHAELIALPRAQVYPLPDGIDFETYAIGLWHLVPRRNAMEKKSRSQKNPGVKDLTAKDAASAKGGALSLTQYCATGQHIKQG